MADDCGDVRADLICAVDEARRCAQAATGHRLHEIKTRRRVWDGPRGVGDGTHTDTDVILDPRPRAREPHLRHHILAPGVFEAGDRIVDRVSATLTEADITGRPLAAGEEWFWLIGEDTYRVIGADPEYLEWRVHLRQTRRRKT